MGVILRLREEVGAGEREMKIGVCVSGGKVVWSERNWICLGHKYYCQFALCFNHMSG